MGPPIGGPYRLRNPGGGAAVSGLFFARGNMVKKVFKVNKEFPLSPAERAG
jgi:hypothetical protein